ncbi:hypothetical protein N7G274_002835 [Stereocaulon virgatum]|uniref:Uncharacterized protein n=1 Tax=Stereocaulon virgatum TaxID=373712 RepID=A0ABR4AIR8_9LECA
MLDLPSTLVLSCLMTALSSKNGLRNILNTIIICSIHVLRIGFALGLLCATCDLIGSHITGLEWTLECYETDFKYLFMAIGFPSLVFFSYAGIDFGLDAYDEASPELRNEVLPEEYPPDDGHHDATTQQHVKEPYIADLRIPTLNTMVLLSGLGSQHTRRSIISQDFTINEATKKMKLIEPTAFLKTLIPSTLVLEQPLKVQEPTSSTENANLAVSMKLTRIPTMEPTLPNTMLTQTMAVQEKSRRSQARSPQTGAAKQNKDHCMVHKQQHKAKTAPNTMTLKTAALQKGPKDQLTKNAKDSEVDHSSRKLTRLLLKDFLALKAGVKIPSAKESVFVSEIDAYAQLKSRAMGRLSESSTSDSVCSSSSGEPFFHARVRLTESSKGEALKKRLAKSPPGGGLLCPESDFQARLRNDMQAKGESRRMRSGMSTPGSVSSSTSEESGFQTEFRKAMWPNGETPAGSGRSSRPSTPGSEIEGEKLEL